MANKAYQRVYTQLEAITKATVTLKGNYSGSASASFTIKPKAITPTVLLRMMTCSRPSQR